VAELRGREKPEEVVILGAHLDSWDLGRGALDNGCNAALVIDVARQAAAIAREGARPRRTLRFVLYTGEEAGLWGSFAEVRQQRAELDRLKAQIVFDVGSGKTTGFSLGGRADMRPAVEAALAPASARGPFALTTDAFIGTDNYDYLVEGVPTLVANQDGQPYLPDYHAESDTFDKVDAEQLKANAALAAVVTWGLADLATNPAPRQTRAEVEALVQATGLVDQMKLFGLWEPFVRGSRGRAP
jgi:Zn-dependent M28 family amino/carboxypeptidase